MKRIQNKTRHSIETFITQTNKLRTQQYTIYQSLRTYTTETQPKKLRKGRLPYRSRYYKRKNKHNDPLTLRKKALKMKHDKVIVEKTYELKEDKDLQVMEKEEWMKQSKLFPFAGITLAHNELLEAIETKSNEPIHFDTPYHTGKTFAYTTAGMMMIEKAQKNDPINRHPGFRVLILQPNPEAVIKQTRYIESYLKTIDHDVQVVGLHEDEEEFEREAATMDFEQPEIVVATPIRLREHLTQSDYFRNCKLIVVDDKEAFDATQLETLINDVNSQNAYQEQPRMLYVNYQQEEKVKAYPAETINTVIGHLYDTLNTKKGEKNVVVMDDTQLAAVVIELLASKDLYASNAGSLEVEERQRVFDYINGRKNGIVFVHPSALDGLQPTADRVIACLMNPTNAIVKKAQSLTSSAENTSLLYTTYQSERVQRLSTVHVQEALTSSTTFDDLPHLFVNNDVLMESLLLSTQSVNRAVDTFKALSNENIPRVSIQFAQGNQLEDDLREKNLLKWNHVLHDKNVTKKNFL
mmetsp:Transcript_10863/g.15922  ORF Transcript_10863/g.15922 Transcript_10863/m.15922 type:complete len:523 (-) Transcript_10863:2196-3764(-)